MKKIFLFAICLLLIGPVIFSQSIQNSLISSGGTSATSGGIQMDYSIGEPIIETVSSGSNTLTQGFHQTTLSLVAIENSTLFSEVSIYPNPTSSYIHIDIPNDYDILNIRLLDALGKLVAEHQEISGTITITTEHLAVGTYYLQLINSKDMKFKTYKVVKN